MPTKDLQNPTVPSEDMEDILEELVDDKEINQDEADRLVLSAKEAESNWNMALEKLGAELESKFRSYASRRRLKEQEWIAAILQHQGPSNIKHEKGRMPEFRDLFSGKPHVNITKFRTNLAISRMRDIQFPLGGDFNFHLDVSPLPEVEQLVSDQSPLDPSVAGFLQGQEGEMPGPTVGDQAMSILSEEKDKAYRMEVLIRNQLMESKYGKNARDAMRDWAMLGTGILKGPTIQVKARKFYDNFEDSEGGLQSELTTEFEEVPEIGRVDPRFFYPDPDALEPEDIEDAFELHPLHKKQLIDLAKNPAFMEDQIKLLLERKSDGVSGDHSISLLTLLDSDANLKNRYMVKEYRGPIPKEVLRMMGEIGVEEEEDKLALFYGEVWHSQGIVIRVSLSHIEGDDSLPYAIAIWDKDDASLFGHGMPYMMKDQQRVVASTWQMVLDNAGLSAGPQVVLDKEMIEPANGKWEIEPMKLWYKTEYGGTVNDAFQFTNVPNNQEDLSRVIEAAMNFADMESESPMIQAHTEPQAHVPAMNMGMVLTEANVHQRELSQHWDDYITIPIVKRMVHYNMQYSSDPMIKGNFEVKVGGATERIDNQILAQDIERILATASQNPMYQLQIDEGAAFRRWVAATRAGPEILRSSDQVEREIQRQQEEAANAPPDPDTIRAQAVMMQEETRAQKLQLDAQLSEQEAQLKQAEFQMNTQIKQAEIQLRQTEIEARLMEKQMDLQILVTKLAQQSEMSVAQIMKDLQIAEMNADVRRDMKAADLAKFERAEELKRQFGTGISP